jgi:protocatechuate 3,4-dioxygenase beta subunit
MTHTARLACLFGFATLAVLRAAAQEHGPCATAASAATLAGPAEAGERLIVRGQVFRPDGTTPAGGIVVYAYHTAADGEYHRESGGRPRLSGYVRTDEAGRFELRTIRPAPYPGGRIAAHVHFQLWGAGFLPQHAGDLLFTGDPAISEAERNGDARAGRFGSIRSPERQADGTLVVEHLLRLVERGDRLEAGVTDHGVKPCS